MSEFNNWLLTIDPKLVEIYKAAGTVLVASIAAVIASLIQWRQSQIAHKQWLTAQNKLRMDLFDRRMKTYEDIRAVVDALIANSLTDELFISFNNIRHTARWHFGDDFTNYLDQEYKPRLKEYKIVTSKLEGDIEPEQRKFLVQKKIDISMWFFSNHDDLIKHLEKYMRIVI